MSHVLWRSSGRHIARHPWISTLSVVGVALGVAVVVAIDLAGRSSQASFELATEAITGRATHQIVGGPAGIPEELYVSLRSEHGVRQLAPIIEGSALVGPMRRPLTVLGIDPLAEGPFRGYAKMTSQPGGGLTEFLHSPAALLAAPTAQALGIETGDRFALLAGGLEHELLLAGLLAPEDALQASGIENLMLVDIAIAQEILGLGGRLTRIDLRYQEPAGLEPAGSGSKELASGARVAAATGSADVIERVRALLPTGVRLERSQRRGETAEELTRAFRLNLFTLSLLALLCGGFLIYNSVTFSVVMRRHVFGTLRALGVTRRQLLRLVLVEALAVGFVGSLLGLALGQLLARGLVGMVAQTISDHYFRVAVSNPSADPSSLATGLALGLAASAIAGLRPAWEATRVAPRSAWLRSELESRTRGRTGLAALAGTASILLGAAFLVGSETALWPTFVAVLAVLVGCALLTPAAVQIFGRLLAPPLGVLLGPFGRMAARGLVSNLSRTGVAIAALMLALSVTIGVGLMITSFRATVERWLAASLPADLYFISVEQPGEFTPVSLIRPEWVELIRELPEIERLNLLRRVTVESSVGAVQLVALDMDARSHGAFDLQSGDARSAWEAYHRGSGVLISEPLASRSRLGVGSSIELQTPRGTESLPVDGVFYDYSTDRGYVLIDLDHYRSLWNDRGLTAASAYVRRPEALEEVAEEARTALAGQASLVVTTQRALREQSLQVFDRTFRVTAVLRTLTLAVAVIGILSALMAQQLERTRELGLLRATGVTRRQLWLMVTAQTGLIGFVAGLLSLPVGIAMAAMTTLVINQRSFGWTIPLTIDAGTLWQALAAAVLAALAAGVFPSIRMAATSPAEALRSE